MDDDWVAKYHKGLGLRIEEKGRTVAINPWFGIYGAFLLCLEERWRQRWDSGELDRTALQQEMLQFLPTPEAWRQAQIEMENHELHLRNLRKMSSEELAHYLKTLKQIDPVWVNFGILDRFVARGGQIEGLPSALKKVLGPDIEAMAQSWLSSKARSNEYIKGYGKPLLLASWGKKGITKGLQHLEECPHLNVLDFLLEYVEASFQEGYDSIMHPKWGKGSIKDVLDLKHRGKLVSLSKTLDETEDEDNPDAYKLTIEDQIASDFDDEVRTYIMLEKAIEHLTDEKRQLFFKVYLGDVSPKELSQGDQREYERLRQRVSRTGRFVKGVLREGEIPQKRPPGRPRKRDKES